jgi:chromosome segregation ATPase
MLALTLTLIITLAHIFRVFPESSRLTADNNALRKQASEATAMLQEREATLSDLATQLEVAQSELATAKETESERDMLRARASHECSSRLEHEATLATAARTEEGLRRVIVEGDTRAEEASAALSRCEAERDTAIERADAAAAAMARCEEERDSANARAQEATTALSRCEEERDAAVAAVDDAHAEASEWWASKQAMASEMTHLRAQLIDATAALESIKAQSSTEMAAKSNEITYLNKQLTDALTAVQRAHDERDAMSVLVTESSNTESALRVELTDALAAVKLAEEEMSDLRGRLDAATVELDDVRGRDTPELRRQLDDTIKTRDALQVSVVVTLFGVRI